MSDTFPVLRHRHGRPLSLEPQLDAEPPPALTPESFAERLYDALEPIATQDPDVGWSLLIYVNALGQMFQLVDEWVRDGPAGPGWSLLLDLDRCPDEALPWLAQFVGVRLAPGSTPAEQRARILSTDGFRRGTVAALQGAAQGTLTGSKRLIFRERDGALLGHPGNPEYAYFLSVHTWASETPDPAATLAALLAQKPGGLVLDYAAITMQDYQNVKDTNATYAIVKTTFSTYERLAQNQPG